jgi:hypothetical protein
MRPNGLTIAKTLTQVSVVTDTSGGKKSVARRSTGLDYSSPSPTALCVRLRNPRLDVLNNHRQPSLMRPATDWLGSPLHEMKPA